MAIKIEEVPFGSEKYQALLPLRYDILRKPLGLELTLQDTASDHEECHIAAWENEQLVGCVLLRPIDATRIKLRQMAVADSFQGQRVGVRLVQFAEELAWSRGFQIIEMHARKSAQAFYEKLGYGAEGDAFLEVTVPHIKMSKRLLSVSSRVA